MAQLKQLNRSECHKVNMDQDVGQHVGESEGIVQPLGPRNGGGAPSSQQSLWGKGKK